MTTPTTNQTPTEAPTTNASSVSSNPDLPSPVAGPSAPDDPISVDDLLPRLRHRREFLAISIEALVDQRDQINGTLKLERTALEANAKRARLDLNARIARDRAELAKIDRVLAAEKPRGQRGAS